ncbi:GNAT family N-acetyltransferase [Turicibacter bilis]|uniref:GNAT family N-acetyltransferase n=1 Tax=Turicibacter bilis TaxID=2735723 RepID=A0A9Q9CFJ3_9FIRM|nr:GNAT family N-acetyltransferase [Turicibacter bilis]MBS3199164.1 GNAT family N-acetyltransferase [Turicibacter bilis]UUF07655.1 GNAT family N-acetyltransferase [Turicibacter bilis]
MIFKEINHPDDLNIAFQIRINVFVNEQGVPLEDELDEFDTLNDSCHHILAYYQDQPVGTGRIRFVDGVGKLERICILKDYRKFGLGKLIISGLESIAMEKGINKFKLHGQTHAEGFYQKLGYQTASEVFIEDGIPHLLMQKTL